MLKVIETINSIRGLRDKIKYVVIAKKILISLPSRFDAKLSVIEEGKDVNAFSLDQMYGSLITYETRTSKTKSSDKEVIFKVAKSSKSKEYSDKVI